MEPIDSTTPNGVNIKYYRRISTEGYDGVENMFNVMFATYDAGHRASKIVTSGMFSCLFGLKTYLNIMQKTKFPLFYTGATIFFTSRFASHTVDAIRGSPYTPMPEDMKAYWKYEDEIQKNG